MKEPIFIGVAWPYVNGNLHVGHVAGYLLPADMTARFFRLLGHQVLMASGSDCFGTPITVEADKKGVTPSEIVETYHARNVELFKNLGLSFDLYTKTVTENHKKITQDFLLAFHKKNLLEVKTEPQYYSATQQKFLPDRYVEGTCPVCGFTEARSDQCDNCGNLLSQNLKNPVSKIDKKPVELKDTDHLFIKWNELQKPIKGYVDSRSGKWREWVKSETDKWLERGLASRAVTRDLDWGVEIPDEIAKGLKGAENKRIYVWFDAVIGYYSASVEWGQIHKKEISEFWKNKNAKHYYFMGKDNLVFHTIFWPGELMTYDESLNLPDFPAINQYLNLDGAKFSKSRGVVVDTAEFIEKFGADALRFYLTTILPENSDANFVWSDFFKKNNDLLVGHLGNYIHRTLSLYKGYELSGDIEDEVLTHCETALSRSIEFLKKSEFKNYYQEIEELAKYANGLFDMKKPWTTKKENKDMFLADGPSLVALTFVIASLLEPITPTATQQYYDMNGLSVHDLWTNGGNLSHYLPTILSQLKNRDPQPLFKKFEEEI
jgi:methionyl-tRNA synthetase